MIEVVTIADSKGVSHGYRVIPSEPGRFHRWRGVISRIGASSIYAVEQDTFGAWSCTCKDATITARREQRQCKHVRAIREHLGEGKQMNKDEERRILEQLSRPFDPAFVKWKPQAVKNGRAMAIAYLDARAIMDRLDEVVGLGGWRDTYTVLPDGAVVCRLELRVDGEWNYHEDVGAQSDQADEHDRDKAAFSDALKRVAVKFGIGRYLYRVGPAWVDYDERSKRIVKAPTLPAWALPAGAKAAPVPSATSASDANQKIVEAAINYDRIMSDKGHFATGELIEYLVTHVGPRETWGPHNQTQLRECTSHFVSVARQVQEQEVGA